ncbi:MAG: restriction endonuclease subunit S [Nocardioidaceae bacterium]|nr:restriction endonuclease subunit S [Nocardioidaceae bacterium]
MTPPGWRECTLGDLAGETGGRIQTGPFGSQLHASDYLPHGTPVVMPVNIGDNRLIEAGVARVGPADAERLSRHRLCVGDIVYSRRGDVEKRALVREPQVDWLCGTGCLLVRVQGDEVDATYVSYWLGSPEIKAWVTQHAIGATMPNLNTGILSAVPVLVPPLAEQRSIATMLGALDDKIESNRRLLSTVLSLTRAEVKAVVGIAGATALPVAALARFVNGGAYTKGATGTGRMVLRIAELNSGPGGSTVYTEFDVPEDKTARAGDLLMSWSGSLDVYRWTREEAIINQHIFKVIPNGLPAWLVHDRLKAVMPTFQSIAKDKATTMGHIQRGHLESTTVAMPSSEQIDQMDARLGPLWDRLLLAEREIHTLAALRDALLPDLLSGRLRVPEAQAISQ